MQNNKPTLMLIAVIPEELKDDAVDALMASSLISGFSLFSISGFSREHSQFSIKEQVEGYRAFHRFEVAHMPEQTEKVLATLSTISNNGNIRYWILPIQDSGYL